MKFSKLSLMVMFIMTIVWGSSSLSWFSMWMALEMNTMMFMPLMWMGSFQQHSESVMKYFLIQGISSMMFIGLALSLNMPIYFQLSNYIYVIMFITIMLKIGMFPFMFWYVEVIVKCTFLSMKMILTIQKFLPMMMMSYIFYELKLTWLYIFIIVNAILGAISALNQTGLKKIISFSSITQMSWMVMSIYMGFSLYLIYFFVYSLIVIYLCSFISNNMIYLFLDLLMIKNMFFSLNILSLAGLPPFSGFVIKWLVFDFMIINGYYLLGFFLIMSSLITLYFYLRLMFVVPIMSMVNLKFFNYIYSNIFLKIMGIMNLVVIPFMLIIYL
uniref:NADH-ubiquinone oxidoreductase chain 2 n=1 Tax=Achelia bituberculata TaxID=262805 RepID=A7E1P4_ACHBT|nr:NADH dehydrogenase subunit 2 [Achelia bituberculata]